MAPLPAGLGLACGTLALALAANEMQVVQFSQCACAASGPKRRHSGSVGVWFAAKL